MQFQPVNKKKTLAEQVCSRIKESILNGDMKPGDVLPAEPELSAQFSVSRAVVRDAARMLMAQGLVDIKHGKGMYVTLSQDEALADALLSALRRKKSTVWDLQEFEELIHPEVCVLAAENGTDQEKKEALELAYQYIDKYSDLAHKEYKKQKQNSAEEKDELSYLFYKFRASIYKMSKNKLLELLGTTVFRLRRLRRWQETENKVYTKESLEKAIIHEKNAVIEEIDLIVENNPAAIREKIKQKLNLPRAAVEAMKSTEIGNIVQIPLDINHFINYQENKTGIKTDKKI